VSVGQIILVIDDANAWCCVACPGTELVALNVA
jgi:hypothetical protein